MLVGWSVSNLTRARDLGFFSNQTLALDLSSFSDLSGLELLLLSVLEVILRPETPRDLGPTATSVQFRIRFLILEGFELIWLPPKPYSTHHSSPPKFLRTEKWLAPKPRLLLNSLLTGSSSQEAPVRDSPPKNEFPQEETGNFRSRRHWALILALAVVALQGKIRKTFWTIGQNAHGKKI